MGNPFSSGAANDGSADNGDGADGHGAGEGFRVRASKEVHVTPLLMPDHAAPTNQSLEWSARTMQLDADGDQAHAFLGPFVLAGDRKPGKKYLRGKDFDANLVDVEEKKSSSSLPSHKQLSSSGAPPTSTSTTSTTPTDSSHDNNNNNNNNNTNNTSNNQRPNSRQKGGKRRRRKRKGR